MSSSIEKLLADVGWTANDANDTIADSKLPHTTHSGALKLGDIELRCHRLNTGEVVFEAEDVEAFFMSIGELPE